MCRCRPRLPARRCAVAIGDQVRAGQPVIVPSPVMVLPVAEPPFRRLPIRPHVARSGAPACVLLNDPRSIIVSHNPPLFTACRYGAP